MRVAERLDLVLANTRLGGSYRKYITRTIESESGHYYSIGMTALFIIPEVYKPNYSLFT